MFIGDLIYLLLYPEGTDVVGTQLLAGQAEAQVDNHTLCPG